MRARMVDEPYSFVAISLRNTANESGVVVSSFRMQQLLAVFSGRSPLAHGSESLRLEEFDTLLDASPPPSSVPRPGLPLVHANAALLHIVLQGIIEALSLSPSVTFTLP